MTFHPCQVYPAPRRFTPAYGDTALIAGVANGVVMGSHLSQQHLVLPQVPLPWLRVPLHTWTLYALGRVVAGALLLVLARCVCVCVCVEEQVC